MIDVIDTYATAPSRGMRFQGVPCIKFFQNSCTKSLQVIYNPLPLHPIRKNGF